MKETLQRRLAYHEAGHAVVNRASGLTIAFVSIDKGGGRTDVDGLDLPDVDNITPEECRDLVEPALIGVLAGGPAEERVTGSQEPSLAERDRTAAVTYAWGCVPRGGTVEEWRDQLGARAKALVESHGAAIDAVANALMLEGRLTGQTVDELMARAS